MEVEKNEEGSYKILVSFPPKKPGETGRRFTTLVARAGDVEASLKVYDNTSFLVIIDNGQKVPYKYEENRNYNNIDSEFLRNCYLALDKLYEGAGDIIIEGEKINVVKEVMGNIHKELYIKRLPIFSTSVYNFELYTIFLNPNVGGHFITYEGAYGISKRGEGYNSPISIFGHELIHAYNHLVDHKGYFARREKKYDSTLYNKEGELLPNFNRGFPNEEERYVVVELANQINKNLGEDLRDNYAMYDYYTKGVLSIEKDINKIQE